jgi:hypothetical protein
VDSRNYGQRFRVPQVKGLIDTQDAQDFSLHRRNWDRADAQYR